MAFLRIAGCCWFVLVLAQVRAGDFKDEELADLVRSQASVYFSAFQHPDTGILYGARLKGAGSWTTPEAVLQELPHPWGYGSRIADTVLHTGHMLVALLEAYEARPEPWMRDQIRKHFAALKRIGSLPETHPKPGKPALRGLVPRGPHPNDSRAYYDDSSMDQHTTYILALAVYAGSPLATPEEKKWIADSLGKVGRRLEGNGWRILRADGETQAHVGFAWTGINSSHASILLPAVMGLYRGTGDEHWKRAYEIFLEEREGKRWEVMHPGPHVRINAHPIYANQNAFRLHAYRRFETDPGRRQVIDGLMEQSIELQLGRDFPGEMYRRFRSPEDWKRLQEACGWKDTELRGAEEAWGMFEPSMLEGTERATAALAHVRFPLGGFHMALMSQNDETVRRVVPAVWRMLSTVDLKKIEAGETHYLFTVVGLHLYAQHFSGRGEEEPGEDEYGEKLKIALSVGIGPANDVVVEGDWAYAIGRGRSSLYVLDVSETANPVVVGELGGLGKARQLVVQDGFAYVTAREDKLFVVDVRKAAEPRLVSHYDTVEFATGIAISGDVLFVACRHYGVELVDVRDPSRPRHLSTVRTGEAQSVAARGKILYVGVWASSEVVIVDATDPRAPVVVGRVDLDGFGDGVDVRDGYLYAATGHHSKAQPRKMMGDPGFGRGHGLEIFRLEDPVTPVFVSRVKFPRFYSRGNDTWRVIVSNGHAFVADTHNGMFVVDVRQPEEPEIVGRLELNHVDRHQMVDFVGGLWPVRDRVYVAGGWTDLHVVEVPGVAARPVLEDAEGPVIGEAVKQPSRDGSRVYRPEGQVYAVDFWNDELAVVACGSDGVHLVDLGEAEPARIAKRETEGLVTDVAVDGNRVLIAQGEGGLTICELTASGDGLVELGSYHEKGAQIRQVELAGRFALVVDGATRVRMIDITNPAKPVSVMKDNQYGLLYGDQLMRGTMEDGRYAAAFWHVSGLHWYDLKGASGPVHADNWAARFGSPNGLASLGDRVLVTTRGGYLLVGREERRPLEEVPRFRVGETNAHLGRPTVVGNRLYCAERAYGLITVADITDLEKPLLLEQNTIEGTPGRIAVSETLIAIPNGYGGLVVRDRNR